MQQLAVFTLRNALSRAGECALWSCAPHVECLKVAEPIEDDLAERRVMEKLLEMVGFVRVRAAVDASS